jgi:hypothetical protein
VYEPQSWQISRQHVLGLLPLMRLTPAQRKDLLSLRYPLPYSVVAPVFASLGYDMDAFIDRMGGSP